MHPHGFDGNCEVTIAGDTGPHPVHYLGATALTVPYAPLFNHVEADELALVLASIETVENALARASETKPAVGIHARCTTHSDSAPVTINVKGRFLIALTTPEASRWFHIDHLHHPGLQLAHVDFV